MTTPETEQYERSIDAVEKANARLWRRVALTLAVVVAIVTGALIYVSTTVGDIRTTQIENTKKVSADDSCIVHAVNGLLKDVPLAFSGDKVRNDYAKIVKKC